MPLHKKLKNAEMIYEAMRYKSLIRSRRDGLTQQSSSVYLVAESGNR